MKLRIAEAYERGEPTGTVALVQVQGIWLEVETAIAFLRMAWAAKRSGVDLEPTSGFRFPQDQRVLYLQRMDQPGDSAEVRRRKAEIRRTRGIAARPGWSRHQNGTAVDVKTGLSAAAAAAGRSSGIYDWLKANAPRFGFAVGTVANEPWHLERVASFERPEDLVS